MAEPPRKDPASIAALASALHDGERVKLDRDDAVAVATALSGEVDRSCDARARIAEKQSLPVVCSRGCNGCCEEMILVYLPEAVRVARWLMEPAQRKTRDDFLAAYPAWQKAVGSAPERLAEARATASNDEYLVKHRAQWRKRVMCAFNRNGDCSIYPVRPITCRNAHAVETHLLCSGANTTDQPAQRLAFPPLDHYLVQAERIMENAHNALGGDKGRTRALCEHVHSLLQTAMAAQRSKRR